MKIYYGSIPFEVSKNLFRKLFGRFKFSSNLFEVKAYSSGLMISGKGLGHGVGLCQIGALGLAKEGMSYEKILNHYYPNLKLVSLY